MKSWYEVYLDEIRLKKNAKNYIKDKIKHKKIFIKMLKKYSTKTGKLIETGCGTGIISAYMASIGYNVIGIDIDKKILKLANNISKEYFSGKENNLILKEESIFDMNYKNQEIDICFSNGVLEHFEDEEILKTLKIQLNIAKYVIVSIPTEFFNRDEALYGNERFLPLYYWRYLITKAGGRILEEHSFHYMSWIEKITNLNKIGRVRPFRLFVIEKTRLHG